MEPNLPEEPLKESKENAEQGFTQAAIAFIKDRIDIRQGCDVQGTTESIQKDMEFKGPNVWILICSIFIASIGLNVNATAVIIGAMLISPLMGPILGIGLAVGTYDWTLLKRALVNLAITVVISLLTAYIYFRVSPLKEIQDELLSRTQPTLLDVLVAIFGGVAGIVGGSRREKTNVIPGVAIATALMPPLCTAGFGLATRNYTFFLGASYLFFINIVFIALSTVAVVRYLHFPVRSWVNSQQRAKVHSYMVLFAVAVIVPSTFIFWDVIKKSVFKQRVDNFVSENIKFEGTEVINTKIVHNDTLPLIELFLIGETVSTEEESFLNKKKADYGLGSAKLLLFQSKDLSKEIENLNIATQQERERLMSDLYSEKERLLKDREEQIVFLENKILALQPRSLPLENLREEVKIEYSEINRFAYAEAIEFRDSSGPDTIPTFLLRWDKSMNVRAKTNLKKEKENRLGQWLQVRLQLDTVRIIAY